MERDHTLLLIRDLLEHISDRCEQWSDASERTQHFLVQSMHQDLSQLQNLCESLPAPSGQAAALAPAW